MQCDRINDHHPGHESGYGTINDQRVKRDIIVIGASAGGVEALQEIFATFPSGMEAIVSVVLHRGPQPSELMSVLAGRSMLPVVEPNRPMTLKPGTIYLAPADHHLLFQRGSVIRRRGPRAQHKAID